jgi:hypothetical protein
VPGSLFPSLLQNQLLLISFQFVIYRSVKTYDSTTTVSFFVCEMTLSNTKVNSVKKKLLITYSSEHTHCAGMEYHGMIHSQYNPLFPVTSVILPQCHISLDFKDVN